jgi:hypothetical protein
MAASSTAASSNSRGLAILKDLLTPVLFSPDSVKVCIAFDIAVWQSADRLEVLLGGVICAGSFFWKRRLIHFVSSDLKWGEGASNKRRERVP